MKGGGSKLDMIELKTLARRATGSLYRGNRKTILWEALLLLFLIGWLDYLTSIEMSLAAFYWIPVAIVTWYEGIRAGCWFSVLSVAFAVSTDIASGLAHSHPFFLFWDIGNRLLSLIIFAWMLAKIKSLYGEAQKASQLEIELKSSQAAYWELQGFSYVISHNLRGPLRAIDGYSQIVLDEHGLELGVSAQSYLKNVQASSQKMADLIDALIELAEFSGGEVHREQLDLSALAQSISQDLQKREPRRPVIFDCQPGITGRGDRKLIRVALQNLLDNAWKFTGRQPSPQVRFGMVQNGGHPIYFIRDNGVGFSMAYSNHLFRPFQSLHTVGEFEGVGVGLSITDRIVQRHGGRIWAEGVEGKGATFYFTLQKESFELERGPKRRSFADLSVSHLALE
jgi:signal transduction histidine kinase